MSLHLIYMYRRSALTLVLTLLTAMAWSRPLVPPTDDDGHLLWLPRDTMAHASVAVPALRSATLDLARAELCRSWRGGAVELRLDASLPDDDGYHICLGGKAMAQAAARLTLASGTVPSDKPTTTAATAARPTVVTARRPLGLLYGAYALLRWQATGCGDTCWTSHPRLALRMLDHWDNPDGSVERGYAGKSIWKWEEIGKGSMSAYMRQRLAVYARANASVGINAIVVNNVNASPVMVTQPYLVKLKTIADFLRPYGIRVWLSVNFASPMALHETKTADPLDSSVRRWWQRKARDIYRLIPDFGGFLVKANSEGQPGPGDYHRSHADGANMLADALKPYGGRVVWRSFVYGANHKNEDRVMQAVSEFKPLDGLFHDNVVLQSKNGPLDFQPREPYAPIFDNMKQTRQMAELQITQEYTGQSRHLVFLAPMWKEFFAFVDPAGRGFEGLAGVANTGDDTNWCGHPFSQANWYAFGRLAWDTSLTAEAIAHEWLLQTFGRGDSVTMAALEDMMLSSREACVDYMMPLGLHHIFKFDHHYGPEPMGYRPDYPAEWCPVYYHKADSLGLGFDRTMATGSGATRQYPEPYRSLYENLKTCPEEYLLWFHHVPWTYRLRNGRTLWQSLTDHYAAGVRRVAAYRVLWRSPMVRQYIDNERWLQVDALLGEQLDNARQWQHVCLDFFKGFAVK